MLESNIHVKTNQFDGPLGLLLLLIQKEEMDVKSLDVNIITREYLAYLDRMRELNFDVAGDYLYMAATLLFLKSKSYVSEDKIKQLLGKDEEGLGITSKADLISRLEELQRFQKLGQSLWDHTEKKGYEVFTKPKVNRKSIQDTILIPMELDKLTEVMMDLIRKEKRKYTMIKRDRLSIKEKLVFLKGYLQVDEPTDFETLLREDSKGDDNTIDNIVITFISLLELARLKKIEVYQNESFGNIYITVKESLQTFNVDLADGFDPEEDAAAASDEELKKKLEEKVEQVQAELAQEEATPVEASAVESEGSKESKVSNEEIQVAPGNIDEQKNDDQVKLEVENKVEVPTDILQ